MIPKKIHYCWFGKKPLPNLAVKCIASWKKYCPDYEIIEWNEDNFDVCSCDYVKEAFEAKKWAFITDYVRLKVLSDYGGIYMDTDVEVIQPLDSFLTEKAFSGFETEDAVPTGIMACEKGFPLFAEMVLEYENRHFIRSDGSFDGMTNVVYITEVCHKKGLKRNNSYQVVEGFALYPKEYFCPKSYLTKEIHCTENTYTIHHFSASWRTKKQNRWFDFEANIARKLGEERAAALFRIWLWRLARSLYSFGLAEMIKKIARIIKRGENL